MNNSACRLFYYTCTNPTKKESTKSLSHMIGASHSQDQSSATRHGTQRPCLRKGYPYEHFCDDPVRLDVQLLRVCRQIYDEAALLPYAENYFIIHQTLISPFQKAFVQQFDLEKRSAMHTVAIMKNWEYFIGFVPQLLPGLKRLWFETNRRMNYDKQDRATKQRNRVKLYSQVEFPSLIGVTVNHAPDSIKDGDEGMDERLELALLGKQSL